MKIVQILIFAGSVVANLRNLRHSSFKKHHGMDTGAKIRRTAVRASGQPKFDQLTWILKKYQSMQGELSQAHKREIYNHYFSKYISQMQHRSRG